MLIGRESRPTRLFRACYPAGGPRSAGLPRVTENRAGGVL